MTLVYLLLLFETKHLFADFFLQNEYMLGKFRQSGWVKPLAAHCGVHAAMTLAICLAFRPELAWLAAVDFVVHFTMDRIKASPFMLGRYKALSAREIVSATPEERRHNKYFWWSLGFDQYVHQLTNLALVVCLTFW